MAATIWDWSSTAADNATADTGLTWAEGQAPSSVNDSARMMMKRVSDLLKDIGGIAEVAGTANAITMTSYNSFSAYRDGLVVTFRAGSTNTDETTINVNTVGVKPIVKFDVGGETDLVGGEIIANGIYGLVYSEALNASAGAWLLVNPSPVHVQGTKTDDPVDADEFLIYDSEDSSKAKKLTWASIKATLKAYFDPIYAPISLASSALLKSGGTMTGNLILKGNPTSNLMAATKQYVDALPLSKSYESPEQTISVAGTITINHTLGVVPQLTTAVLVCKTAEQGFSVGNQISYWAGFHTDSGNSRGCHIMATASQFKIQYSNQAGSTFQVFNSSGGIITLTNDNWRLVIRAYA